MQLYQRRGFNDFFQDTFAFIKTNGKHYFKNYFIINGIFLLILMVLSYFFSKFYTDFIFGNILNQGNNTTSINNYFNDNFGLFLLLVFVFLIVSLLAAIISYSYTPIYLKLYEEKGGPFFDTKDIISAYKINIGKIISYLLCGILIGIPLLFAAGIVSFILMITIIGFLALPLLFGLIMLFYGMTLMEYLDNKRNIWDSFGYAWSLITSKFWPAVGAIGLFLVMLYIVQIIVGLISSIFSTASMLTILDQGTFNESSGTGAIITTLLIFALSFLISSLSSCILQLCQGIIFYGLKEEKEHINTKSAIDEIGTGE